MQINFGQLVVVSGGQMQIGIEQSRQRSWPVHIHKYEYIYRIQMQIEIKQKKLQNVTKLRKCSCRYEAEQCVLEPGAAGININSMGSWLAIYIWLMSNKYIHQTRIFFCLLLCWPNIFLLQILPPSFLSNLYLVQKQKNNVFVLESRINSRICLGLLAFFIIKI